MELALGSQHGTDTLLVWKVARPKTALNGSRVTIVTTALNAEAESAAPGELRRSDRLRETWVRSRIVQDLPASWRREAAASRPAAPDLS